MIKKILDRLLLFSIGTLFLSMQDISAQSVAVWLIALSLTALGLYFDEKRAAIGLPLFYGVLYLFFPGTALLPAGDLLRRLLASLPVVFRLSAACDRPLGALSPVGVDCDGIRAFCISAFILRHKTKQFSFRRTDPLAGHRNRAGYAAAD